MWHKTPNHQTPLKRASSLGSSSSNSTNANSNKETSVSYWRAKLNKEKQDKDAVKDANELLLCDMLDALRRKVDEIEQDKWLYEEKIFN